MSDQEDRLIRCFASVFPTLKEEEIPAISVDSVGVWDSLASVTLVAVIQEEFNLEIDSADITDLTSFEAFQTYLRQHVPVAD
jgi:acyl carrier protein